MKQPLRELEETVVDAWPAAEAAELEGWLLRFSDGPSRRGNSVAALDARSERTLEERVAEVEAWYAGKGRKATFQIGPSVQPKELEQVLVARGYREDGRTAFSVAPAFPLSALPRPAGIEVRIDGKVTPPWLSVASSAGRYSSDVDGLRGYFKRLGTRCRFATVLDPHGDGIACCAAIASEDRLGVYAMLCLPEQRRRGAARAMLRALAESALHDGMREVYLLVELENEPARALYASIGFQDVYTYHYRVQPG